MPAQEMEKTEQKRRLHKPDFSGMSVEDALYFWGLLMLPLGLAGMWIVTDWVVPRFTQTSCIFWQLFGMYCPGCGGTRALIALAHGHFLESLWYHPLIGYCVIMYLVFMLSHTLEKLHVPFVKGMKFREWILYGMLVVLAVNWVLKNILKFGFGIVMLDAVVLAIF